jgi:hypothetical protein
MYRNPSFKSSAYRSLSLSSSAFNANRDTGIIALDGCTSTMSLGEYGQHDDAFLFDEKEFEYNKYGLFKKVYSGDRNNYESDELRVLDLQTQQYFNFFYKSMDERAVFEADYKILCYEEHEILVGHVKSFCKTERLLEQIKLAEAEIREYENDPLVIAMQSKFDKSKKSKSSHDIKLASLKHTGSKFDKSKKSKSSDNVSSSRTAPGLKVFERTDEDSGSPQNIFIYHNSGKPKGFFRRALDRLSKITLAKKNSQGEEAGKVKRITSRRIGF